MRRYLCAWCGSTPTLDDDELAPFRLRVNSVQAELVGGSFFTFDSALCAGTWLLDVHADPFQTVGVKDHDKSK